MSTEWQITCGVLALLLAIVVLGLQIARARKRNARPRHQGWALVVVPTDSACGLQCPHPYCGRPVDVLRGNRGPMIKLEPCGHLATRNELVGAL